VQREVVVAAAVSAAAESLKEEGDNIFGD
jgi:hypothetical protein